MIRILKVTYVQVLIGIVLGVAVGFLTPSFTPAAKVISDTFINMIKMLITPIIFTTVVLGISGAGELRKIGRVGGKALIYFEVVSTLALFIGMIVANWVQPGSGIEHKNFDPGTIASYSQKGNELNWGEFLSHIVPSNIVKAFAEGDILQVLLFSVLFGIGISRIGPKGEPLIRGLDALSGVLFRVLKIIMILAPVGAFAGMAYTVGKLGVASLLPLGKLMLSVYLTMAVFIFIVLGGILRFYRLSLWRLLGYVKDEILLVLGTSSSESALPNVMEKLERAGCHKSVVGLIIPTGYSFNLDGTAIYLSMAVIFIAQAFQIPLSIGQQIALLGVLMVTSKGAAAVTGGGFIILASTLSAMKVIPAEGLALLLGVDRFMSEARSMTNLIGNAVATVVIARSENELDLTRYHELVG
jgi:aerobic C4-dicarboxylate transport protein